jgi:hypothetical protein
VTKTIAIYVGSFVLVLAVIFVTGVALGYMQLPWMNIQRQVTTHSLQYVQTHQTMMLDYLADYQRAADDPHRNAAEIELCQQAALLDRSEWPAQAEAFISTHCH